MLVSDSATKDVSSKTIEIYMPTPTPSLSKQQFTITPEEALESEVETRVYERNGTYLDCHRFAPSTPPHILQNQCQMIFFSFTMTPTQGSAKWRGSHGALGHRKEHLLLTRGFPIGCCAFVIVIGLKLEFLKLNQLGYGQNVRICSIISVKS